MATVRVLVDTDILIDYFNSGRHARILEDRRHVIYYSVVTRKELLAKEGLKDSERRAIIDALHRFRVVPLTQAIAARYATVRQAGALADGMLTDDEVLAFAGTSFSFPE